MSAASDLNQQCQCVTLDEERLDLALRRESEQLGLAQLMSSHPHLFARTAVFVSPEALSTMQAVVSAVERVVALPAYRRHSLAAAHPHAAHALALRGAHLGFDFHLSERGPQLIEINTNPGGALLNVLLRDAQQVCCEPVRRAAAAPLPDLFAIFQEEWRLARGAAPIAQVAIVDDDPQAQFLYPEFLLFQRLCGARGFRALICDARELEVRGDRLWAGDQPLDLVYNRLTDFQLELPEHAALAEALRRDLAVITPCPSAYALYADKRRLTVLSSRAALLDLGAHPSDADLLAAHVPETIEVTPSLREQLWSERKALFFKPQTGYGGRAAYRGDKITKSAFEQVVSQPYVAQRLVTPSLRKLRIGAELRELKVDIRNFAYAGAVQLVCARLYHGQTTNFRSEGGGFAPVYPA